MTLTDLWNQINHYTFAFKEHHFIALQVDTLDFNQLKLIKIHKLKMLLWHQLVCQSKTSLFKPTEVKVTVGAEPELVSRWFTFCPVVHLYQVSVVVKARLSQPPWNVQCPPPQSDTKATLTPHWCDIAVGHLPLCNAELGLAKSRIRAFIIWLLWCYGTTQEDSHYEEQKQGTRLVPKLHPPILLTCLKSQHSAVYSPFSLIFLVTLSHP